MTCHVPPGAVPHGWCPECQHLILAHRIDGECAACTVFIELKPGMKVLVTTDTDLDYNETVVMLDSLQKQFSGVKFVILANATIQVVDDEEEHGGSSPSPPEDIVREGAAPERAAPSASP